MRDQLELLNAPVEWIEDNGIHTAVERGDAGTDAIRDFFRSPQQIVGSPVVEIHSRVDRELRNRRFRFLPFLKNPDEICIDSTDPERIPVAFSRKALYFLPIAFDHFGR